MGDWRKTQYKIGPTPDPLAEVDDFKYSGAALLVGVLFFGGIAALVVWLLTL